ncbi:MAG: PHB depolymerase family esterase [Rhodospirillales bacterium]|nr:PHB depolymerase family esterase [Rhodospirillales bacterium]
MKTGLRRYEFSERLADILGASRRDVRVRVTLLVTGGLIPPGPRGPGAPPATADYAADLLVGVMAAPQQIHTVEAVRCFRALRPTAIADDATSPGVIVGVPATRRDHRQRAAPPLALAQFEFGDALARLLDEARDGDVRAIARDVFGVWVNRGFPVAALQLAAWMDGRRTVIAQRYELPEGGQLPAWLDPGRGGTADPGLFHSVFLPVSKLIEIAALTAPSEKGTPSVIELGQTISSLAHLARNGRHRRAWEKFVSVAESAQAAVDAAAGTAADTAQARAPRLTEVTDFGSNPGNLKMLAYVPESLGATPALVVVLHGCTQTATSYDTGTGWSTLAERYGFALLLPEQRRTNNPMRCFNWFRTDDNARDSGEALSIRQMIDEMAARHGIDHSRVFVTGLSAGGAMTSVMLATYPEVFAGGAVIAGVPYRSASGLQEAFEVIFQGPTRPAQDWGDLVRAASLHQGPWPKIAVWHGDADSTVKPSNAAESVKQWLDVHGLAATEPEVERTQRFVRSVWKDESGAARVESVVVAGMAHGAPIDPSGEDGCGVAGPFIVDAGVSSSLMIARSWGLIGERRPAIDVSFEAEPTRAPKAKATEPDASIAPPVMAAPPAEAIRPTVLDKEVPALAPRTDGLPVAIEIPIRTASPQSDSSPGKAERMDERKADAPGADQTARRGGEGPSPGVDIGGILGRAFEAAGALRSLRQARRQGPSAGLRAGGIDVQGLIEKSLETAERFAALGEKRSGQAGSGPGARPSGRGTIGGIDVQSILTKSFEAAGLLHPRGDGPSRPGRTVDIAGSGWEGDGWQLLDDADRGPGGGRVLFGYASSGVNCDIGNKVMVASRTLTLGGSPQLSYQRKLSLDAAINILTTASFSVLVDGIPVDEVSVRGMEFSEDEWTLRGGIDLARFAGRNVTLTVELAANSNVCIEVAAKAWITGITIEDVAAA